MREIKYRVWDKENEVMINWFPVMLFDNGKPYISLTSPDGIHNSRDWEYRYDMELMQYTGLKDSKGIEIYEGDVCKRNGHIFAIVFYEGAFCIDRAKGLDSLTVMHHGGALYSFMSDIEIIGNIYENPELLQDSK